MQNLMGNPRQSVIVVLSISSTSQIANQVMPETAPSCGLSPTLRLDHEMKLFFMRFSFLFAWLMQRKNGNSHIPDNI